MFQMQRTTRTKTKTTNSRRWLARLVCLKGEQIGASAGYKPTAAGCSWRLNGKLTFSQRTGVQGGRVGRVGVHRLQLAAACQHKLVQWQRAHRAAKRLACF